MKTSIIIVTFFTVLLFTACGSESSPKNDTSSKTKTIPAFPQLPGASSPPDTDK